MVTDKLPFAIWNIFINKLYTEISIFYFNLPNPHTYLRLIIICLVYVKIEYGY